MRPRMIGDPRRTLAVRDGRHRHKTGNNGKSAAPNDAERGLAMLMEKKGRK